MANIQGKKGEKCLVPNNTCGVPGTHVLAELAQLSAADGCSGERCMEHLSLEDVSICPIPTHISP